VLTPQQWRNSGFFGTKAEEAIVAQMLTQVDNAFDHFDIAGLIHMGMEEVQKGRTTCNQDGKGRQYLDSRYLSMHNPKLLVDLREYNEVRPTCCPRRLCPSPSPLTPTHHFASSSSERT